MSTRSAKWFCINCFLHLHTVSYTVSYTASYTVSFTGTRTRSLKRFDEHRLRPGICRTVLVCLLRFPILTSLFFWFSFDEKRREQLFVELARRSSHRSLLPERNRWFLVAITSAFLQGDACGNESVRMKINQTITCTDSRRTYLQECYLWEIAKGSRVIVQKQSGPPTLSLSLFSNEHTANWPAAQGESNLVILAWWF